MEVQEFLIQITSLKKYVVLRIFFKNNTTYLYNAIN